MNKTIVFSEGMTVRERFDEYSKHVVRGGYVTTPEMKSGIDKLFDTFENTRQGLVVYGNTGTGKTIFFEILRRVVRPKSPLHFKQRTTIEIVQEYNVNGHESLIKLNANDIFFDDLGAENKGVYFGDRVEVMESLIQERYSKRHAVRSFFTTNLTPSEIEQRYGSRCWKRLKETCEHVLLDDGDKRELKSFIGFPAVEFPPTPEEKQWAEQYEQHRAEARLKEYPKRLTLGEQLKNQFKESFGEFETKKK